MLAPMRYKDFIWPNNPRTYSISFRRQTALHKVPMGAYTIEDLGRTCRVMRGEGEFYGPDAYENFKKLATVFYDGTEGVLFHPVWMSTNAFFTDLQLLQEPREDYVAYAFTFEESFPGYTGMKQVSGSGKETGVFCIAADGDNIWTIAARYSTTAAQILRLNPDISNGNLLLPGQKVRVK